MYQLHLEHSMLKPEEMPPVEIVASQSPSIDELVMGAISDDTHAGGNEAIDDLTIRISAPKERTNSNAPDSTTPNEPKRRGRPVGSVNGKTTRRSKADVENELARVTAELAAERARNNDAAVAELAQQVEMAVYLMFGAIASKRGPHWGMQAGEAKDIGKTGALALAPHAEALRRYSPWGMFAATLGGAFYVRIQEDRRLIALHGVATTEEQHG